MAPEPVEGDEEEAAAANGQLGREKMAVLVTEVLDGASFWVQKAEEPRVAWLEEQMQALAGSPPGPRVRPTP